MSIYNKKIGKKIESAAMKATATDSLSDTIATTVVLCTTLISKFTDIHIDGHCGVLVGLFICYAGIQAAKDTIAPLLGQPPQPEFVNSIEQLVLNHKEILGIHDLIVHDYGPGRVMISLHAEIPASGNILEYHDLIDNIERELSAKLQCEAVIHMDPVQNDDEETQKLKECTLNLLKEIDDNLRIHDFRIVSGPTHTNVLFDIVVPFKYSLKDEELKQTIEEKMKQWNGSYFPIITVDKDYNKD